MSERALSNEVIRESFPEIWKYLEEPNVTDLDFNCGNLWLSTVSEIPRSIEDADIDAHIMTRYASLVAQSVGCNFNPGDNTACADTENLRITCVHESQSRSGLSVNIRKFEYGLRNSREKALSDKFITEEVMNFLDNVARANISIFFCGFPGHGKTETLKLIASNLPKYEKVIAIEDVGEINYPVINEGANCDELKVIKGNYKENIEKALRMNAARILFGETRGHEAKYLLECMSNGLPVMSTIHMIDARNLADRFLNMLEDNRESQRIVNQIYRDAGICVLVKRTADERGRLHRRVEQVCLYTRNEEEDVNKHILIVEDGILHKERIPREFAEKIEYANGYGMFEAAGR